MQKKIISNFLVKLHSFPNIMSIKERLKWRVYSSESDTRRDHVTQFYFNLAYQSEVVVIILRMQVYVQSHHTNTRVQNTALGYNVN